MADIYSDKSWEKSGRNEFIKQCKSFTDSNDLRLLIHNGCCQVINGQLKAELLASTFSEIITLSDEIANILTDVLILCDIETQAAENKDQREQYISLLSLCSNRVVSETILKERLDYDTTGEAKIIQNKKSANTKFIKLKTKLFYKQQKFNLFREESEGYSKLIAELCQDGTFDTDYMIQVIRSLIGCFNLDPNRVLDVILECFECRLYLKDCFISLIKNFFDNSSTLSQIVAFKFSFYHNDITIETPESLYTVVALLLESQLINLDHIYNYLSPSDASILEHHKNDLNEAKALAKKSNIALVGGDEKEKEMEEDKVFDLEKYNQTVNNQKLGLCLALLTIGDWKTAKELMKHLPDYYAMTNDKIIKQICLLIHYTMDKFYHQHSGLPILIVKKIKPITYSTVTGKSNIDQAENTSELRSTVFSMILALGPYIYEDSLLVTKIIRIGKYLMTSPMAEQMKYDLLSILDESVLPAVSLISSNCGLSEELWLFVKLFPYEHRYRLYSNWKVDHQISIMIKTRSAIMKRIKYIMKRLSRENVKLSGRQIGKLSHSNPSFLFEYILSQIQCYDNFIGPVVDSLKYLTSISYDVLVYSVIEALSDPNKDRTKHDGATISAWLLSLANFCGSVVKKYTVELPGLLQFIANQLKAEKSLDLLILKEIIQKMAGIEATEEMTNEQLAAMAGGELLRNEGGYFNQVRNTRKSSVRLKEALLESNLAMPLCILMAQQRNCILFSEQQHSHLKLVGRLYDQCQETLVQYGSFLSSNLSIDDYIGRLPKLHKLITEYNLSPDVAFYLTRPMFVHHINMKFEELKKNERSSKYQQLYSEAWETITSPSIELIIPSFPSNFWDDLSPRFFVTFWTLSTFDLEVPKSSYDREVDRLKNQIQQTEDNKDLVQNKKKKEIERCRLLQEKLLEEQLRQDEHVRRVKQRLEKEKDQWFQQKSIKFQIVTQFLQHCLFPRSIFTSIDALFCGKFVQLLHSIKTPHFPTLLCYDKIFNDITYTMCSCTINEANHYGRFLCVLLETVMRWHKDKAIFEKECLKFPGFIQVDYENYRHVCHKWHLYLTKAFLFCLDSADYIQIRNSLIILTKIAPHFPAITGFAQILERYVEQIRNAEKEKRPDIYALATGYSGLLKMKKSSLVPENEFHLKERKKTVNQANANKTEGTNNLRKDSVVKTEQSSPRRSPPKEKRNDVTKANNSETTNDSKGNEKKKIKTSDSSKNDRVSKKEEKMIKTETNSTPGSPNYYYPRSPSQGRHAHSESENKESKRRKVDNKSRDERDKDRNENSDRRRYGEGDSASSSPSNKSTEKTKTSNRKRDASDESGADNKRRKGDGDNKSKKSSNEDRERKNIDDKKHKHTSHRNKIAD